MLLQLRNFMYMLFVLSLALTTALATPILPANAPTALINPVSPLTLATNTTFTTPPSPLEFPTPALHYYVRYADYNFSNPGLPHSIWQYSVREFQASFQAEMNRKHIRACVPIPHWNGTGGALNFTIDDATPNKDDLGRPGIWITMLSCDKFGDAWGEDENVRLPGSIELLHRPPGESEVILAKARLSLETVEQMREQPFRSSALANVKTNAARERANVMTWCPGSSIL